MEIKPGLSALITGGAAGIGKALCLALAERGVFISIIDVAEERGKEVALEVAGKNFKDHDDSEFPSCQFIRCDVSNSGELASAFHKHRETYGGLDICINSAGIANPLNFYEDQTDGTLSWRHTLNVNLTAVIDCTRLAIAAMQATKRGGVIVNIASAAGLYPLYHDPVYSGSKSGVVMFTRSLVPYRKKGIRINVLCPEFVETDMGLKIDPRIYGKLDGFIPMKLIIKGVFQLITDESKAGSCLWVTNRYGLEYWPAQTEEAKYLVPSRSSKHIPSKVMLDVQLPQSFEKVVVHTLSHDFRKATRIIESPLKLPVKAHHVLIKVIYAGVNASDVNFSSGRYFNGKREGLNSKLPFDAGFEAVGIIVAVGESVTGLTVGTPAAIMTYGSYSEFTEVSAKHVLPVPSLNPEVVAMLTSGLTASIALEKAGQMGSEKIVLVTAAAGGTGQFAVQLAKLAGNHVVATCGGKEKATLLKGLGVDRVIDYKIEDPKKVLKQEYPQGVDIIYESVGGDMFELCLNALGVSGRLIVIGMISKYLGDSGWTPSTYTGLCEKILAKSQTVTGFFLPNYGNLWQEHLNRLFGLYSSGKLKVSIDPKSFIGIHSVADAVEYLHSGKSRGKVVVCIDPTVAQQTAKL